MNARTRRGDTYTLSPFFKPSAAYFAGVRPCRTTVEVTALPTPIAIELKCIAEVAPG